MDKLYRLTGGVLDFRRLENSRASHGGYQAALLKEQELSDAECEEGGSTVSNPSSDSGRSIPWLRYATCFLLLTLYSLLLITYSHRRPSDVECGRQVALWSPLNEAIDYTEYDFDNEFDHQTIYRGPPTPELEKAWGKLWKYDGVHFPVDKLRLVNRTTHSPDGRELARLEGREDAVAANFAVFHQLHCVNLIRQYTWRDWYFRHPDKVQTPPDMLASDVSTRMHVDHCIEALRIALMCHGDTTPYFTMITPDAPHGALSDFSAHHKCRKFDKLQTWTEEHGIASWTVKPGEDSANDF